MNLDLNKVIIIILLLKWNTSPFYLVFSVDCKNILQGLIWNTSKSASKSAILTFSVFFRCDSIRKTCSSKRSTYLLVTPVVEDFLFHLSRQHTVCLMFESQNEPRISIDVSTGQFKKRETLPESRVTARHIMQWPHPGLKPRPIMIHSPE